MLRFHQSITLALLACMAVIFSRCSLMHEDRSDCPSGLFVRFVYDYNTQRADMFKDHVGHVTLYVFDENGQKVAERSISNSSSAQPLASYGYAMHFTTAELPAGHKYRLMAIAMQKDWDEALATPGAKYRRPSVSSDASLVISLDHEAADANGLHAVNNSSPLDTLWHTLKVMSHELTYGYNIPDIQHTTKPYSVYPIDEQMVSVQEDYATYATISLVRDTKHLNVTLRQLDNPADINADDYEVTITDHNAVLASDNTLASSDNILYLPYAQWTTRFDDSGMAIEGDIHPATRATATERTAHYNLMFNRLMYDDEAPGNAAQLSIRNKKSGETVAQINLPAILAEGRIAYEWQNYSPQEYLDREYDYELDFMLKGDKWQYVDIRIHVLSWARRKQNVEL